MRFRPKKARARGHELSAFCIFLHKFRRLADSACSQNPFRLGQCDPGRSSFRLARIHRPALTRRVWKARGKIRPARYAVDGCVIVAMAGAIAEMVLLGFNCEGHWSDVTEIERLIPDDPVDRRKARLARAVW